MHLLSRNTAAGRRSRWSSEPSLLEALDAAVNSGIRVPMREIRRGGECVTLARPVMVQCIHECGYWSVAGSGVRIISRGDTLEEAVDDFCECFLEMKADFYDEVRPGFEGIYRVYRRFIEGYRWPSTQSS